MSEVKEVLIYKRTHVGDPNRDGRFGVNDCMGSVRNRRFDAVIGIGGTGWEPRTHNIARKLNWLGIGPYKTYGVWSRGAVVSFDKFVLLDDQGPLLSEVAPLLANHMYNTNRRVVMSSNLPPEIRREVASLLEMAKGADPQIPPSAPLGLKARLRDRRCRIC